MVKQFWTELQNFISSVVIDASAIWIEAFPYSALSRKEELYKNQTLSKQDLRSN